MILFITTAVKTSNPSTELVTKPNVIYLTVVLSVDVVFYSSAIVTRFCHLR
jgi:hypothetical protein